MRLSRSLCAVVGDVIATTGSHATLDELFRSAGAPGDPQGLSHGSKWKTWLFHVGQDPNIDALAVLGNILEEFMDVPPEDSMALSEWQDKRSRVVAVLEQSGLRYFCFGRVLPQGTLPENDPPPVFNSPSRQPVKPSSVEELLSIIVRGLRNAMHPLTHRRKGAQPLTFGSEYDVQDLLHALLRPWIGDIRAEEFTPSYAGSSTRMDFLLPDYKLVIEMKFVRYSAHVKRIGDELVLDIKHYEKHPDCETLWCVIYDPHHLIANSRGLEGDLSGPHKSKEGEVTVKAFVL